MKKILIIEDEKEIRNILRVYLNACGYEVEEAEDGEEGINLFYAKTFDLVLLDVMLPKKDGWSICREIKQYSSVPVIIMTARTDENDEVFGLELGADDYITKPFSNKVLVARIKTILKNRENRKEDILKVGNIEINDISHTVNVNGRKVELALKSMKF